jgi:Sulfotransferase family
MSAVAVHDRFSLDEVADPVFVLAAPRSFSSVVCAMLGQHPELHGLPETHLFLEDTMDDWWRRVDGESYQMAHGLIRAVAQICFGEQTERSVASAQAWLRRRRAETSGFVFEELARAAFPTTLVDKSPSTVYDLASMHRLLRFFPDARFIHLVRHPRSYCDSVVKYMNLLASPAYRPREREAEDSGAPQWIRDLANWPIRGQVESRVDPQGGWVTLNRNVLTFLDAVPADRWTTVRGEDLLGEPERTLRELLGWLGMRSDPDVIEQMLHPERSPYAHFGPRGARNGNDILFLERATLRPPSDGRTLSGLSPEVVELAGRFGYV